MSKVIIVTGASRGIGLCVTQYLLSHQHKVLLVARTDAPLAALKEQYPRQVEYLTADAADLSTAQRVVDQAVQSFGRLDGIVINHGTLLPLERLANADLAEWKRIYDINFFSALALAKAAIPQLRTSQGRIVVTSSGAAVNAYASWGAYGSSKAAVNSLVRHLAVEEPTIASIAVGPGRVDTEMQKELREGGADVMASGDYASFVSAYEEGKLNPPEKPAEVIAKMAVDLSLEHSGRYVSWNAPDMSAYHWE